MLNIAVTGLGIICAIGNDAETVLSSLRAKRTGIAPMRYLQSSHRELPVGEVKLSDEEMKRMLGLDGDKGVVLSKSSNGVDADAVISRTALMGAIAIRQALEHAQWSMVNGQWPMKGKRIVVISGTTVAGMDITERYFMQMKKDDALLHLLEKHDCGSSTREMADIAGLKDAEVCTISTACSSAINAIILGAEMLQNNEADIVIAGGTEALSRFHLNGFNSLMLLDKEQCRPFDKNRAGLNLGEGAAFVVLQKEVSPPKGGWGVFIRGYANRCDAFHQTASSENGEGAYLAMSEALKMAGLKPQDIQYINAHGTGTPNNDSSESAAIRRVFGEAVPPVSSTKGFTGHATSASGSIEAVISILSLQNNFVPVNLGWEEQDETCITPFGNEKLRVKNGELKNVLCNSFGFGGNDSALIIGASTGPSGGGESCPPSPGLHPALSGRVKQKDTRARVVADDTITDIEQLQDSRDYISPGEARRMTRLMKAATITSLRALQKAEVESPDAIITATAYGMLETSEKFLVDMLENGEETLSPTLFMQSTHNTLSSSIAIRTKCHGYNMTYSQGKDSLEWALRDARRLIESGKAKTVLVGCHDEATPTFQEFCRRMGKPVPPTLYSKSIVLKRRSF